MIANRDLALACARLDMRSSLCRLPSCKLAGRFYVPGYLWQTSNWAEGGRDRQSKPSRGASRLRDELRQARLDADLTQEVVAEEMDWSISKIIRIETGAVGISTNDLTALLRLYKVRDPKRVKDLVVRGRAARKQTWYSKYRPVLTPTYFQYIEYETSASIIRSYEEIVVPGLLQTEEYAVSIAQQYRPNNTAKTVSSLVEVRMKRQELLLGRPNPPLLFFILDEAAIRRLLGDESLRKEQLEKLISMAEKQEIVIEIIPFGVGLHSGMSNVFSILEFPEPSGDVLYFEGVRESILSRDVTDEVTVYRELFEELRGISLGPKGTLDYLEELLTRSVKRLILYNSIASINPSREGKCIHFQKS